MILLCCVFVVSVFVVCCFRCVVVLLVVGVMVVCCGTNALGCLVVMWVICWLFVGFWLFDSGCCWAVLLLLFDYFVSLLIW